MSISAVAFLIPFGLFKFLCLVVFVRTKRDPPVHLHKIPLWIWTWHNSFKKTSFILEYWKTFTSPNENPFSLCFWIAAVLTRNQARTGHIERVGVCVASLHVVNSAYTPSCREHARYGQAFMRTEHEPWLLQDRIWLWEEPTHFPRYFLFLPKWARKSKVSQVQNKKIWNLGLFTTGTEACLFESCRESCENTEEYMQVILAMVKRRVLV